MDLTLIIIIALGITVVVSLSLLVYLKKRLDGIDGFNGIHKDMEEEEEGPIIGSFGDDESLKKREKKRNSKRGYQSVEEYLKNMTLKKKSIGGYDPEDVIVKMQELIKVVRAEESEKNSDASAAEEIIKRKEIEEALRKERSIRLAAQNQIVQLERKIEDLEKEPRGYDDEAEKLHSLLESLEASKQDILMKFGNKTTEETEALRQESEFLKQENSDLKELIMNESQLISENVGILMQRAEQLKMWVSDHNNEEEKIPE